PQALQGIQQALEPRQVVPDFCENHTPEAGAFEKRLNPGIKLIQRQDGLAPGVFNLMFNLALDIKRIDGSDESTSPQAPVVPNHSLRQVGQQEAYDAPVIDLEGDQRLRELVGKNIQLTIPDDAAKETEGGTGWEAGQIGRASCRGRG